MKIIVTGSGTSFGMPVIGCNCPACTSSDSRDKRYRPSIFVKDGGENPSEILVDVGAEFRLQALKYGINRLDAVLMTHSHADHCHGIDDLRIFSHTAPAPDSADKNRGASESPGEGLAIFGNRGTLGDLKNRFSYIFTQTQAGGSKPKIALKNIEDFSGENPLAIGTIRVVPVPMLHGKLQTCGYLIYSALSAEKRSIAYLTDCNFISDESIELLKKYGGKIEHVIIDGLREKPHSTHCSFLQSLSYADRLMSANTWITHICHDMKHTEIQDYIDSHLQEFPNLQKSVQLGGSVSPAFDGLELFV